MHMVCNHSIFQLHFSHRYEWPPKFAMDLVQPTDLADGFVEFQLRVSKFLQIVETI